VENASLLHASLTPGLRPACAERLLACLPYAPRLRLERADSLVRASSLAGLALALIAAARAHGAVFAGVAALRLREGEKPRFEHGPYFSISHTRSRVACIACVSDEVGLDLETAPTEPAFAPSYQKLQRWTAAEATIKAAGAGLRRIRDVRVDLASLASELDGRRYVLRELRLTPDTFGHVASVQPVCLGIEGVSLDENGFSASLERVLGLSAQGQQ
jgi:phosphopantetheinyl transferase